jgi:hypothetical protein
MASYEQPGAAQMPPSYQPGAGSLKRETDVEYGPPQENEKGTYDDESTGEETSRNWWYIGIQALAVLLGFGAIFLWWTAQTKPITTLQIEVFANADGAKDLIDKGSDLIDKGSDLVDSILRRDDASATSPEISIYCITKVNCERFKQMISDEKVRLLTFATLTFFNV